MDVRILTLFLSGFCLDCRDMRYLSGSGHPELSCGVASAATSELSAVTVSCFIDTFQVVP